MSQKLSSPVAVISIDIGKNSFHVVGPKYARCNRAASVGVTRPALPLRCTLNFRNGSFATSALCVCCARCPE